MCIDDIIEKCKAKSEDLCSARIDVYVIYRDIYLMLSRFKKERKLGKINKTLRNDMENVSYDSISGIKGIYFRLRYAYLITFEKES